MITLQLHIPCKAFPLNLNAFAVNHQVSVIKKMMKVKQQEQAGNRFNFVKRFLPDLLVRIHHHSMRT